MRTKNKKPTVKKNIKVCQVDIGYMPEKNEIKHIITQPIYCGNCNRIIMKSALTFPCARTLCVSCIMCQILGKAFKQFKIDSQFIEIDCSCGNDSISVSYEEFKKIFFISENCLKHGEAKCEKCAFWVTELGRIKKCQNHPENDILLFCKTCQSEICQLCSEKFHSNHELVDLNQMGNEIDYLNQNKFLSKNFNEFEERFQKITGEFEKEINSEYDFNIHKIDELIVGLKNIKQNYIIQMNEKKEKTRLILKIIKYVYYYYYRCVQLKPNDYHLLEFLHQNKYELINLTFLPSTTLKKLLTQCNNIIEPLKIETFEYKINVRNTYSFVAHNLIEHEGYVFSLIQLNMRFLASCSEDKKIVIWDLYKGNKYSVIEKAHNSAIFSLCNIPQKNIFCSGSFCEIKIWSSTDFKEQYTIKGHSNYICQLKMVKAQLYTNEYKDLLASGSFDFTINLWNIDKKECLITLIGHSGNVNSIVEIDMDESSIATCSYDKTIKFWNITDQRCCYTLEAHDSPVYALIVLKDGRLVSGSYKDIKIWDLKEKKSTVTFIEKNLGVYYFAQLDDGRLVSCSFQSINFWDVFNNRWIYSLNEHTNFITCLLILQDGRLASASDDKTVKIWE